MRTYFVAAIAIALFALPATHAADPISISGSYLVGSPVAYLAIDACGTDAALTNGVDSSCAAIPPGYGGASVTLSASDALDSIVEAGVCFYGAAGFLSCGDATVPAGATAFSVSSLGGVAVEWTVSFA